MASKSLKAQKSELASTQKQLELLSSGIFLSGALPTFSERISQQGLNVLHPKTLEVLQMNIGYMCNQVCAHCHVDAGPDRKEMMTRSTLEKCLKIIETTSVHTLDLTGGAPEMHPDFRWFVECASALGVKDFIVRSNLTILRANKKYYDLPAFFKMHNIHIVSSLPFYKKEKTDRQRGSGVFQKSIVAIQKLNEQGYGQPDSPLVLDLVYNPSGAFLPGDQKALEHDYKKALKEDFNIDFNQLFTITNMPISRFLSYLLASENYEDYMYSLVEAYNPAALDNVMCTNTLSIRWDGYLYDCDFNQMLDLKLDNPIQHLDGFDLDRIQDREICISQHCYGCTAGAGSSCQGTVT
ncbi:MAG: radical SAM/Cys-rich protein [Flavobacteriaceae bacterium]|jgi:radical SAM/Cys-rich protein|tara:strand:+ start:5747 stop:6802 length:1056 start_codon:yes stop_codon:yes gene_type:complete